MRRPYLVFSVTILCLLFLSACHGLHTVDENCNMLVWNPACEMIYRNSCEMGNDEACNRLDEKGLREYGGPPELEAEPLEVIIQPEEVEPETLVQVEQEELGQIIIISPKPHEHLGTYFFSQWEEFPGVDGYAVKFVFPNGDFMLAIANCYLQSHSSPTPDICRNAGGIVTYSGEISDPPQYNICELFDGENDAILVIRGLIDESEMQPRIIAWGEVAVFIDCP